MNFSHTFFKLLFLTLMTLTLAACGGSTTGPSNPDPDPDPNEPAAGAPVIDSFTASDTTVNPGATVTLSWTLSGGSATTLTLDNNIGEVTGDSVTVTPSQTTEYTLTAENSEGSDSASVTVTVTPAEFADAPTNLSGELPRSYAMRSGNVYTIEEDVLVPTGTTLLIEAGAIVKFRRDQFASDIDGGTRYIDIVVDGTLDVNGTEADPVIFTSLKDDSAGGDTNGDGVGSSATAGDWGSLTARSAGVLDVENATFKFSIYGMNLSSGTLTATNITAQDATSAVRTVPNVSPSVTNLSTSRVDYGGVLVQGGQMSNDVTWGKGDATFIIEDDVLVTSDATLTVNPGTVIKFRRDQFASDIDGGTRYVDIVVDGTLEVNGTEAEPVTFTSLRDDSVAGDTYGSSDSAAAIADFGSVTLRANASASLTNVNARYAVAALKSDGADLTVEGMAVQDSTTAISISPSDAPTVTNLSVARVDYGGVLVRGGQMSSDVTWGKGDATFIIEDDVLITSSATLAINPGTVVKFKYDQFASTIDGGTRYVDMIVDGALNVNGTVADPVVFTSLRDDSVDGDSNGDGGASAPADGNWGTIVFRAGSSGSAQNVTVKFATSDPLFP